MRHSAGAATALDRLRSPPPPRAPEAFFPPLDLRRRRYKMMGIGRVGQSGRGMRDELKRISFASNLDKGFLHSLMSILEEEWMRGVAALSQIALQCHRTPLQGGMQCKRGKGNE